MNGNHCRFLEEAKGSCLTLPQQLADQVTKVQVEANVRLILSTFQKLGPLINIQKSILFLVQIIEFIGVILDSVQARAFPLEAQFQALGTIIESLRNHPIITARNCRKLLRHRASYTYMVQHARLQLRPLQTWLVSVYWLGQNHLGVVVTLPLSVITTLLWWLDPTTVCVGVPFSKLQPTMFLVTNAFALSWGLIWGSSEPRASDLRQNSPYTST